MKNNKIEIEDYFKEGMFGIVILFSIPIAILLLPFYGLVQLIDFLDNKLNNPT